MRGHTAKPCPLASTTERPLVFTSRAKTWRPATMSRCISTRSFRTASTRSPTSSLVSVHCRQCGVSLALPAPCAVRVENKATDVSFQVFFLCLSLPCLRLRFPCPVYFIHPAGMLSRDALERHRSSSCEGSSRRAPPSHLVGQLGYFALCFGSLVSALDSAAPSTGTSE